MPRLLKGAPGPRMHWGSGLAIGLFVSLAGCASAGTPEAQTPPVLATQPNASSPPNSAPIPATATTAPPSKQQAIPMQPPLAGDIGTAAPVLLRAAAPNGRWVALCQARQDTNHDGKLQVEVEAHGELVGDRLQSFWISGTGSGEAIDQFVAHSPDGHFVALVRAGRLLLVDTWAGTQTDLSARGADLRDDRAPYLGHRGLRFDPTGQRLLYLRSTSDVASTNPRVVVRELGTGSEREFEVGEGLLWRVDFDATGQLLIARVVTSDTNKNGKLQWPYPARQSSDNGCTGPVPSYTVWEYPGDQPTVRVLRLGAKAWSEAPGFVASFGAGWLQRDEKGALSLHGLQTVVPLLSSECNARVLHSDPLRQLAVVACLGAKNGPALELVGPGYRKPLNLQLAPFEVDIELPGMPFLVPLYAKEASALLDLDTRKTQTLGETDWVVATYGKRALVRRGDTLLSYNDGQLSPIAGKVQAMKSALRTGSMVLVPPLLADLETGKLLGEVTARALALSEQGAVLVPASYPSAPKELPRGPLRWQPVPTSGP